MLNNSIKFLIANKLIAFILLILILGWGIINMPFQYGLGFLPKNPVSVDAIPDIGENQQIVYTEWQGQSPEDIENQVTFPLSSRLLGIPGVKTIRSSSMFGFSSIHVIFEDEIDFYWSRSRILEKLNSLPTQLLPQGIKPVLGPDATSLGQIFWYTIEGHDENGKVTGGWDLHEIRSIQDFYIKNTLSSVTGVSEVASIGGYVKEYQIDVNRELIKQYKISLLDIVDAVKESNSEIGAKTLEINQAEYYVRGLGYISGINDIENTVVKSIEFTPIRIKDIAKVSIGPAERRGILDKEGAEVVGGVVVSRFGANTMDVIKNIKKSIEKFKSGLPEKILKDGTKSKLTIVPFYDRGVLINETLRTLEDALTFEILITVLVVIVILFNFKISGFISGLMPFAVLMVFISMKIFDVDANILALSGIAIAIGTMVDMGIILTENIQRHLEENTNSNSIDDVVYNATIEVSGAILTAGLTTVISFIPIFALTGPEGKLFTPLAFTKTMAIASSMVITLIIMPPLASLIFRKVNFTKFISYVTNIIIIILGTIILVYFNNLGLILICFGLIGLLDRSEVLSKDLAGKLRIIITIIGILVFLSLHWRPLGFNKSVMGNVIFVIVACGGVLFFFYMLRKHYVRILAWTLKNKILFLSIPILSVFLAIWIMINLGKEFMPSLDEGAFLLMPTSMPHSGVSENKRVLKQLDIAVSNMPEIETVVGKAGRVESVLDPAPLSMYENIIQYKPEFIMDSMGKPIAFETDVNGLFKTKSGRFFENGQGLEEQELIIKKNGEFYRNWRTSIKNKEDIWNEIVKVTQLPGVTSAPKLQPIETRLVMLQTGMRAPMGIKVRGRNLNDIEEFSLRIESLLKKVDGIKKEAVFADRLIGKPYLEIKIDRDRINKYGLSIKKVQAELEVAIGGKIITETVEGRERYGVRVRYPRELRDSPEDLGDIYIEMKNGGFIPINELVKINYRQGPRSIKSENGFLVGYIVFDKIEGYAEIDVIENARLLIKEKIKNGELVLPAGVDYDFAGTYEQQIHAEKTLAYVIPLVLILVFLILYFQFNSASISFMVFTGIIVSFSGGFILLWLYGQPWFLNFSLSGINIRDMFHIKTINLSVAIWVGFIALFGIATDDGVVMATYLKQSFSKYRPCTIVDIRKSVIEAGERRIRPCLMTTATTILALLPILTSKGRGSDIMIPMAIPILGGMLMAIISLFIVPILFCWKEELLIRE